MHKQPIGKLIPQQSQRQDSLLEQLKDLQVAANRLGMYEAADLVRALVENRR